MSPELERAIAQERERCETAVIQELRRLKFVAGGPYAMDEADVRAAIRGAEHAA